MSKSALGRGLGVLLGPSGVSPAKASNTESVKTAADSAERVQRVPLTRIQPSPLQPRKDFNEDAIKELADSIREQGVLQPLVVRSVGDHFELIAGERRWRASQIAGLKEVPIIVRQADDVVALELMLIENLQREDLNPIEEALGYEQLMHQFKLRQEDVSVKVGKNRATVANSLRLLKLAPQIQHWIRNGQLSAGHGKVLLGIDNLEEQTLAATDVIKESLSVRATEELVERLARKIRGTTESGKTKGTPEKDVHTIDLERRLQERLATKVQMRYRKGKGNLVIHFYNDEDLERLLAMLGVPNE